MNIQLQQMTEALRQRGHRQLYCLSGNADWSVAQAQRFWQALPGDWLQIVPTVDSEPHCLGLPFGTATRAVSFRAARTLLGQEFTHAVFDARTGFDVEALAIVAGALAAGSWLLLLLPRWSQWSRVPDSDSVRWSEQPNAIAVPNFVAHCQRTLLQASTPVWREGEVMPMTALAGAILSSNATKRQPWSPPCGEPTPDQQRLLQQLLQAEPGIYCLMADRGRGKSTLAGMLAAKWRVLKPTAKVWVTAPKRAACDQLLQRAGIETEFIAPDALLAHCHAAGAHHSPLADWLIVDEAAALPAPQLRALLPYFRHCLLLTTVQGYEGTGRGFLLKFCAELQESGVPWHALRLSAPVRWAMDDPLEATIAQLLLLDAEQALALPLVLPAMTSLTKAQKRLPDPAQLTPLSELSIHTYQATQLSAAPQCLSRFYGLLTSAHYRTSPLDLRRLLDAPGQQFWLAQTAEQQIVAAAWLVPEGGLSASLAQAIWRGERRPRGNLLVQSLAAHAGLPQAAQLRSLRVSRIAVLPDWRRHGVALALLDSIREAARAQQQDFVSVSFGFTPSLWAFWQRCGFHLVRIGTQKEASSGCYAAMAIYPCSDAGRQFLQRAQADFIRRWPYQVVADWMDWPSDYPLHDVLSRDALSSGDGVVAKVGLSGADDAALDDDDWVELQGFAYAHRPIEASWAALQRMLRIAPPDSLPLLERRLVQAHSVEEIVRAEGLHGQKAWLHACRREVAMFLQAQHRAV